VRKIGIIDDKTRTIAGDTVPNTDENTFPNVDAHKNIHNKWKSQSYEESVPGMNVIGNL